MVFRASLINEDQYYFLKRQLAVVGLFSGLEIILISNIWEAPDYWTIVIAVIGVAALVIQYLLQKKIKGATGERQIEVESDKIRILRKDNSLESLFDLNKVTAIGIQESYGIPGEKVKDLFDELKGKELKNYITIKADGKVHEYHFIFDSYYMLNQLMKVIAVWRARGWPEITILPDD